jgi:insertion element IS1 protein InsB
VHHPLLDTWPPDDVDVLIQRAEEAAVDAMGSSVGKQTAQRWWWHALDHQTGKVVASGCGRRQAQGFLQLKALREPCGITRYATDDWGASTRHLAPAEHQPSKRHTQPIARQHLPLRTRIKRLTRKTIGFSTSPQMQDMVSGVFVNRYEFGVSI